jgi:hypothetical protein
MLVVKSQVAKELKNILLTFFVPSNRSGRGRPSFLAVDKWINAFPHPFRWYGRSISRPIRVYIGHGIQASREIYTWCRRAATKTAAFREKTLSAPVATLR